MIVGFIQRSYQKELAKNEGEPDCTDYWVKLGQYYSQYIGRFGDESPRDSVHLSDIDVAFDKVQNIKEFISDVIFIFEKTLDDINEVVKEAISSPKGEDGIDPDLYNIVQKNQETIPIIIKYYKELLKFSEGKTFDEINQFATYSPENVNFTSEMYEAMNHYQSFLEIVNRKISETNDFISDWADDISNSCEKMSDDILIHNITKKFQDVSFSVIGDKKNFIDGLKKLNAQPKSINSTETQKILTDVMQKSINILDNFKSSLKEMNKMKDTILEIFSKRNQTVNDSPELDAKYTKITKEIKEKYENDPIKWGTENVKDKDGQTAYKYGIHKSLYESIEARINDCELFLPALEDIYKSYQKGQEISQIQTLRSY
jgi:hypothetical protein